MANFDDINQDKVEGGENERGASLPETGEIDIYKDKSRVIMGRIGNPENSIGSMEKFISTIKEKGASIFAIAKFDTFEERKRFRENEDSLEIKRAYSLEKKGFVFNRVKYPTDTDWRIRFQYNLSYNGESVYDAGDSYEEDIIFDNIRSRTEVIVKKGFEKLPDNLKEAIVDLDDWVNDGGGYSNHTGITLDACLETGLITREDYEKIVRARDEGKLILSVMAKIPLENLEEDNKYREYIRDRQSAFTYKGPLSYLTNSMVTGLPIKNGSRLSANQSPARIIAWAIVENNTK